MSPDQTQAPENSRQKGRSAQQDGDIATVAAECMPLTPDSPLPPVDPEFLRARQAILDHTVVFNPLDYLAEIEALCPEVFEVMKLRGAYPLQGKEKLEIPNIYLQEALEAGRVGRETLEQAGHIISQSGQVSTLENFGNIGRHCLATAVIARPIVDALVQQQKISAADARGIIAACAGHDLNKPGEILRRIAHECGAYPGDPYSAEAYVEERELLVRSGIPSDIAGYVVEAGKETGHSSLRNFIRIRDGRPVFITEERLIAASVHLGDDMCYGTKGVFGEEEITALMTPRQRMIAAFFNSEKKGFGYPWMWKEGLAFSEDGAIHDVKLGEDGQILGVKDESPQVDPSDLTLLGHYAYMQNETSSTGICGGIQQLIDPESTEPADEFVVNLVARGLTRDGLSSDGVSWPEYV